MTGQRIRILQGHSERAPAGSIWEIYGERVWRGWQWWLAMPAGGRRGGKIAVKRHDQGYSWEPVDLVPNTAALDVAEAVLSARQMRGGA